MPDLTVGLQPRSNTLVSDLLRTAVSAPLTFGAHAIKGMSLGLLDPTEEVSEILGEDIYQAAPSWARSGAELVGEFLPITTAVGAARHIIPGATVLPRFLQGALAGTTLGATRGFIGGEEPAGIAKHALIEGLIFGGIEGLAGIPALIEQRNLRNLYKSARGTTPYEIGAVDLAITPEASAAAQDVEAFRYRTSPSPRTVARTQRGPLPEAQVVDQTSLDAAMQGNWTHENHGLYGQKLVLQLWEEGEIKTLDGFISKMDKKSVTFQDIAGQREVRLTPGKLFNPIGSPEARLMRGGRMTHVLPPNADLEMRAAQLRYTDLVERLRGSGQLSDNQTNLFLNYVNPRAKGLNDLSLSEVNVLTRLMRRGATGAPGEKVLPTVLDDVIGFMGEEARNINIGAWSWAQPAHHFIEAHTKKLGGVKWLKDIHKAFLYASQQTKKFKIFTADKFSTLAQKGVPGAAKFRRAGIFHGVSAEQRNTIPDLIYRIRKATAAFNKGEPHFTAARAKVISEWEAENAAKWGKTVASRLRTNYLKFAASRDQWIADMVSTGFVDMSKYHKDLMPFLAASEESLAKMFPRVSKLPKHIRELMKTPELGATEADLFKMIDRMVSNYTKVMYTRPAKKFMDLELKGRKVHTSLKRWLSHYADRQRGIPSEVDRKLAESLKGAFRKVPKDIPILGEYAHKFTNNDWMKVSVFFNDMPYLAHLGLRPFSAMRNLLQPMLTTGPMIGNTWLARGYHEAGTNRAATKWIRDAGLLQESLGEYEMRLSLSPRKLDQFGKFMMGMFRKTDEINRFASGLGMKLKFDHFFNRLGMTEEFYTAIKLRRFRATTRKDVRNLGRAYQAGDELLRYDYPKDSPRARQLMDTIKRFTGSKKVNQEATLEKMRLKIVGDAIGDTQWLYGKEHAPIFTHAAGFVGRQMGVYQTWWLNYAQMMKRFMFEYPSKIGGSRDFAPIGMWAVNNLMIAMAFVGLGWEAKKVFRTVGLGPFPTELPLDPPGVQPFRHAAQAFGNYFFRLDPEAAEKNMQTAFRRAWDNWVPGSLVYKEMSKVGWAPHQWARGPGVLRYGDIKFTPEALYSNLGPGAKAAAVLGGRGRGK